MRRKTISPVELTRACLQQIERLNPVLNAFITGTADDALAQAREAETETDQAFDWLSRAVQERSGWIAYLPRDSRLDALHGDTRFDTLRATRVNRG